MINIIVTTIPQDIEHIRHLNGNQIHTSKVKPYRQEKLITTEVYNKDITTCLERIKDAFDRELNWLIIKGLIEASAEGRILKKTPIEEVSTNLIAELLLEHCGERNDNRRIICSPNTYSIFRQIICEDFSVSGSFFLNNTFMGIPIDIELIPGDEIWIIDLTSWNISMTVPEDAVEFDSESRFYRYIRKFRASTPICVGDKLIRIKLIFESQEEKEMRELMDRMRLPKRTAAAHLGFLVPTGESIWLTENPEDGLCVTNIRPKDMRHKTLPQMFNPGAPTLPTEKKKK